MINVDARTIRSLSKGPYAADVLAEFVGSSKKTEAFLVHTPMRRVCNELTAQLSLQLTPMGDTVAEPPFYRTSVRGVFAAGDCVAPYKVTPRAIQVGVTLLLGRLVSLSPRRMVIST